MSGRSRAWCFTLNNYTEEDEQSVRAVPCRYLIYGRETGESGTPHLQGYIYFKCTRTLSAVKRDLPRAHLEAAVGTTLQNITYCSKQGDVYEKGERPATQEEKGKTGGEAQIARYESARAAARRGDFDSIPADLWARHDKHYHREYARARRQPVAANHETRHIWVYGEPGTGKSLGARRACDAVYDGFYLKDPKTVWWDGYDDEKAVIIDDFDKYQVAMAGDMKRWLDIYPFQAQVKGDMKVIRPETILVTSNYMPCQIWEDQVTVDAIHRRVRMVEATELFGAAGTEKIIRDILVSNQSLNTEDTLVRSIDKKRKIEEVDEEKGGQGSVDSAEAEV